MTVQFIGVISDTHGLLRDEVHPIFSGCSLIIHAGDIGALSILRELEQIAPVVAVRGNVDRGDWAGSLRESELLEIDGNRVYVIHDLGSFPLTVPADTVDIVIYGHSHRPNMVYREGTLYLNPGSAGPRRFNLPVSVALMRIEPDGVFPEIVELSV
jgi:putative phosphoesterase